MNLSGDGKLKSERPWLKIELIRDFQDPFLEGKWNNLLSLSYEPLVFQRYEWTKKCWMRFLGQNEELCILAAYDDSELVGLLPLKRKRSKLGNYNMFNFVGSDIYDYTDFLIKNGKEEEVIKEILTYLKKNYHPFRFVARNILGGSASCRHLSFAIKEDRVNGWIYSEDVVPILMLPSIKEGLGSVMKKSLRNDVSRQIRHLSAQEKITLERCDSLEKALRMIDVFFLQHAERWESAKGYSAYKFRERKEFMKDLLIDFFDSGIANVFFLLLDSKPIATCFAMMFNRRFVYLAPSYDINYANYSPGKILLYKLTEYCVEKDYRIFDFGIGKEPYKLQWRCVLSDLHTFFIFSEGRTLIGYLVKAQTRLSMLYMLKFLPFCRRFKFAVYLWRLYKRKQASSDG